MIQISDLRKTFKPEFLRKPVYALKGINLEVREGDLFGFIGPNGSGKSSTIKVVLGLLKATSGKVMLMGRPAGHPESRRYVGYLPEQPYFYDYLTGHELLRFYGKLGGLRGRELQQRIEESAALAGADPVWLERRLRSYSKGMLQRVGLAQALISRPKAVIFDEPMSGLDPMGRRDVRLLLQRLHREGTTVFYSTHVLSDVEAICTRIAMIVDGSIRREGSVSEVIGDHSDGFQIRLSQPLPTGELPADCETTDQFHIHCSTAASKREFLRFALDKNLEIEQMEPLRGSLEDVLAQEVAKV